MKPFSLNAIDRKIFSQADNTTHFFSLLGTANQDGGLYVKVRLLFTANIDYHSGHGLMQRSRIEASSTEHPHIQLVANRATHIFINGKPVGLNQFTRLKSMVRNVLSSAAKSGRLSLFRFKTFHGIYSKSGHVHLRLLL